MVWIKKGRRAFEGGVGQVVAAGGVLALAGSAAALAAAGGSAPTLTALHGIAAAGMGAALLQGLRARRVARKVSSDLDIVAKRLIQLEHRVAHSSRSAAEPGLDPTITEVTGEIGLLGGIIRDLAEAVAAQDRDIVDLKDQMTRSASRIAPVLASVSPAWPNGSPAHQAHPEPSLLPMPRREPALPAIDPETQRAAAVLQAFEADRLELHLQPIVSLPQRKVRFYEALARLRLPDETILVPAEFLPVLEQQGHAAEFDRRVIGRCIAIARHLLSRGSEAIVSVNISPRSMAEPGFLRSVGRIVDAYPDTVGRIVFEFSQRCWRTLDAERAGALAALRDRGVPLALDRATDLRLDPLALADRGVRFVKLPADLMVEADHGKGLDIEIGDLASVLRRAGIKLIAERVEREEIVPDLIDLDVPLAQGFVFAAPRAVRAEVLAQASTGGAAQAESAASAPAPASSDPDPEAASPGDRRPFRDFLRRAG